MHPFSLGKQEMSLPLAPEEENKIDTHLWPYQILNEFLIAIIFQCERYYDTSSSPVLTCDSVIVLIC